MPYHDLPDAIEKKHKSAWFSLPFSAVADRHKGAPYCNWTLDELTFSAQSGFDQGCTNEHHRNAYGFLVNSTAYTQEFGNSLANSEVFIIPQCGHEPPLEQLEILTTKVGALLAA